MSVHVDISDVVKGLDTMTRAARDLRKPLREVRRPLAKSLNEHAAKRQGPEGAWPAWSAAYAQRRRKRRKRGKMLGRLPRLGYKIDKQSLEGKAFAEWAPVHQWGGVVGRGARIPQRMFAFADDAVATLARDKILAHVGEAW